MSSFVLKSDKPYISIWQYPYDNMWTCVLSIRWKFWVLRLAGGDKIAAVDRGVKDLHSSSLLNLEYFICKTSVKCIVIVQLTSSLQNVSQNCSNLRHTHLVLAKSGPIIVTFGQSVTMSTFKLVQYSNAPHVQWLEISFYQWDFSVQDFFSKSIIYPFCWYYCHNNPCIHSCLFIKKKR